MTLPLPGVRYRIQSVDYGTFLERRDVDKVELRLEKDNGTQEWVFIRRSDDTYDIQEPKSGPNAPELLYIDPSTPKNDVISKTNQVPGWSGWKLTQDDKAFLMATINNSKSLVLEATDFTSVEYDDASAVSYNKRNKSYEPEGAEYRWKFVEVSPASLPQDDNNPNNKEYRIRTQIGKAIHPLGKGLSIQNQNAGSHRVWRIEDKGNGKCTIFNVQEKKYLFATTQNVGTRTVGLNSQSQDWSISSTDGELTYSIYYKSRSDTYSLALSNDNVILEKKRNTQNQIWVIEPTDVVDTTTIPSKVVEEPASGPYYLKNWSGALATTFIALQNENKPVPKVIGVVESGKLDFQLQRDETTNEVELYYNVGGYYYLAIDNNSLVTQTNSYKWSTKKVGPDQFYIYHGNNIISGPDPKQPTTFIIKFKDFRLNSPSEPADLWKFIPI